MCGVFTFKTRSLSGSLHEMSLDPQTMVMVHMVKAGLSEVVLK